MRQIPQLILNIHNKKNEAVTIDIEGVIGGVSYDGEDNFNTTPAIKKKLKEIADIDANKITVNIHSPGGIVDDGLAIHDALAQHPAKIETKVYGMTASAATIIAQAGDVRTMSENALYLIHRSWGVAIGNQTDLKEMIDTLEKIDNRIANLYARRANKDAGYFLDLMDENNGSGRFLNAKEATEYGLIDHAFEPMKAAASIDKKLVAAMGLNVPEDCNINHKKAAAPKGERSRKENIIRLLQVNH